MLAHLVDLVLGDLLVLRLQPLLRQKIASPQADSEADYPAAPHPVDVVVYNFDDISGSGFRQSYCRPRLVGSFI
jgi:hypothetical protein